MSKKKNKKNKKRKKIIIEQASHALARLAESDGSGDPTQGETPAPAVATGDGGGSATDGVPTATPPVATATDLVDEEGNLPNETCLNFILIPPSDITLHLAGTKKKRKKTQKHVDIPEVCVQKILQAACGML